MKDALGEIGLLRGSFFNYVDQILPIIHHLYTYCFLTFIGTFTDVYKGKLENLHIVNISSTSSIPKPFCLLSYRTTPYKHHMSIRAFCNIIWTFRPHELQIMTVCRVDWVGMLMPQLNLRARFHSGLIYQLMGVIKMFRFSCIFGIAKSCRPHKKCS